MASSSCSRKKNDVFVSFRGEDVRFNFWSHLHKALKQKSIETYVDERLERGDNISSALLRAIEESEIAVVILSADYASSPWCLEELVHILHCNNQRNKQIHVVPVFYHVDPSDVRKQSGSYEVAFAQLKRRFKDSIHKLNQWRAALTTVAGLSGFTVPIDRSESELIQRIVEDTAKKLNGLPSRIDHLKGLVGIEKSIDRMKSLLLIDSSQDVRVVGIWAMGGLGKTTLADIIYKQFKSLFVGYCFLENVRERWKNGGSISLRDALFSALLRGEKYHLEYAKERLCHKKVLIILDDVDDAEYFEYLVGDDRDWLCPGSRIIITTRNIQVLKNIDVDGVHEVELLDEYNALHLFSLHAFKRTAPTESYEELSREVINYAGGVPLALKVLGCHLHSKSETIWRSALNKLKASPNRKIHDVLRISYDGLDDVEKEIFLAIACLFKGESRDFVREILDVGGHFEDVIRVLIDNSLITITNHYEVIQMHDLIQQTALHIVREESNRPENRSWLLDVNDINHVFTNNVGQTMVKGIILNTLRQDFDLKPDAFKELCNLRFLKIDNLHQASLDFLPRTLRYLNWVGSPLKSLPSSIMAQNLVLLDMPYSKLERHWNGSQDLGNLKFVNLSFSRNLVNIPDLSQANLKTLDLRSCTSLVEVPSLTFSKRISIKKQGMVERPNRYGNPLFYLDGYSLVLSGCSNLKKMSKMSGNLERIFLESTGVEELDFSHWYLDDSLLELDLRNNERLKKLSSNICKLKSLEDLNLSGCLSFKKLPDELPKNLKRLNLIGSAIEQVPASSFECIPGLLDLQIERCTKLETLPNSICMLTSLKVLNLSGCLFFKKLPDELPKNLRRLNLNGTAIEQVPASSFECIPGL